MAHFVRTGMIGVVFACSVALVFASCADGATLLDQGYNDMYNLTFADAHRCFHDWERSHPSDPMGPVSDAAAYLFFEFDRLKVLRSELFANDAEFIKAKKLTPDPHIKSGFQEDLQQAKRLADAILARTPDDETALFATVLRLALQADYTALVEKRYWPSLTEIKEARRYAGELLSKHPDCYDAYLAIGVENYLLSLRPAPERWFLQMTGSEADRQKGIQSLRITAEKGHYLKAYAQVLLAIAALRDKNTDEAKRLLARLAQQYPKNDLFRVELKKMT